MRTFSPPAELRRSAPRDVKLTGGGLALMTIAWLLAVAALPIGTLLVREAKRQSAAADVMATRGVNATAVVDRVWRKSGDGNPRYVALYFDAGGARIYGERQLRQSAWEKLEAGSRVVVRYLPDNPQRWSIAGERQDGLPMAIGFVVPGIMLGIAALCGGAVRWQRSLLTNGRVAPAVITSTHTHKSGEGATHRVIRYEFPLTGGGAQKGKASASKNAAVGNTIYVLYDPDRPARSKPYPFSLVTPDTER